MFHKALAKYYHTWFRDSLDSVAYCEKNGDLARARQYRESAAKWLDIIQDHWDAIEFFSIGDNAFIIDAALPEQFRGYN